MTPHLTPQLIFRNKTFCHLYLQLGSNTCGNLTLNPTLIESKIVYSEKREKGRTKNAEILVFNDSYAFNTTKFCFLSVTRYEAHWEEYRLYNFPILQKQ